MRTVPLLAAALLAVAAAPAPSPSPSPARDAAAICQETGPRLTAGREERPHPLIREPDAVAVVAVLKAISGCSMPVPARSYRIERAAPPPTGRF